MKKVETSKIVYNNGHCRVQVVLRPDETRYAHKPGDDYCHYHLVYAQVFVFANDREESISGVNIFPWVEHEYERYGLFWSQKRIISSTTAAERLEQEVIDAIKYADKYAAEYRGDISDVELVLTNIENVVEAKVELSELGTGDVDQIE